MTTLTIYLEQHPQTPLLHTSDPEVIATLAERLGVRFERWEATQPLPPGAPPEAVLQAYAPQVERLQRERGYRSADVISVDAASGTQMPGQLQALRDKFLCEHTHEEDEVRFFVAGSGLFLLHAQGRVHALQCEQNDLLSVPAGLRHWFDMGPQPAFTCIRLFTDPAGWAARYTGDPIARRFPALA
ncbi:cupin [Corticibacter populi]|uniref:Acireductone dioxygenase n=1 Tax=Corticibacter populi TaxID=1550736 RepID=A0A3M6QKA8_9BURK|nr:cupin [Corticibacter populi]RMX03518.1 cupin [Corticibacter populi]RZS29964.1 acireductone dioxygenase apoprotein [Corticibacter populi]